MPQPKHARMEEEEQEGGVRMGNGVLCHAVVLCVVVHGVVFRARRERE